MFGELVPCGGGSSLPLLQSKIIVGRHPECDVCLRYKSVSARHSELVFSEGCWSIRDLDSRNGTGVNGVRCRQQRLRPHDIVSFGKRRFSIVFKAVSADQPGSTVLCEDEDLAFRFLDDAPAPADSAPSQSPPSQMRSASPEAPDSRRAAAGSLPGNGRAVKSAGQRTIAPTSQPAAARAPQELKPKPKTAPAARLGTAKPSTTRAYLGKLVPSGGGQPIPLLETDLLVGRKSHCDIQIKSATVSGEHCRLKFEEGYWFVHDLNSSNGVKVDGVQCESKCLLPESILSISKHRYEIIYSPTEDAPPPEANPFAQGLLEKLGLDDEIKAGHTPQWMQVDDGDVSSKKWTLDETDDDE